MPQGPPSTRAKSLLKRALTRLDVHAGRHRNTLAGTREAILKRGDVDLVIDVGAHAGEYGTALRAAGYRGEIASFEPVARQFERLLAAAAGDSAWACHNRAAGGGAGTAQINVSGNDGFSSSLLAMEEAHQRAVADSGYERTEKIEIARLDDELAGLSTASRHAYLKVDTQGFEHEVIAGAAAVLPGCAAVELELSLTPLYEGQLLIGEMIELMRGQDFHPTHLEPEFVDPRSGELLQVNGLFQPSERISQANGK
jgi:FkbM family methyltransferase